MKIRTKNECKKKDASQRKAYKTKECRNGIQKLRPLPYPKSIQNLNDIILVT